MNRYLDDGTVSKRLKRLLNTGISFAAVFTILLGVMEYRQRGHLAQAKETMKMIDVWEQRGARRAFRNLSAALEEMIKTSVSDEDRNAARTDRQAYNRLRENVSRAVLSEPEQLANFEEVVYFFTRLSLCIEAELCDVAAAKTFFGDTLVSFMLVFRPSITERNKAYGDTGAPLITLQSKFGRLR